MTHSADIGIRLDSAGVFAAMQLAGERGDMAGFKDALKLAYGPVAKRVFYTAAADYNEYILKQAEALMDASTPEDEASLLFWSELAEIYKSDLF